MDLLEQRERNNIFFLSLEIFDEMGFMMGGGIEILAKIIEQQIGNIFIGRRLISCRHRLRKHRLSTAMGEM